MSIKMFIFTVDFPIFSRISLEFGKMFVCVFAEIPRICTRERNQNRLSILSGLKGYPTRWNSRNSCEFRKFSIQNSRRSSGSHVVHQVGLCMIRTDTRMDRCYQVNLIYPSYAVDNHEWTVTDIFRESLLYQGNECSLITSCHFT